MFVCDLFESTFADELKQLLFRVMMIIVAHWWQSGVVLVACLSSQDHAIIHTYEMYWMLIILNNGINKTLLSNHFYLQ